MSIVDDMLWRYACQKFQPHEREDARLAKALEAARLAPSSFGVQPWRILKVERAHLRKALPALCYGQTSVQDAGHLLILAYFHDLNEAHLKEHTALIASQRSFTEPEANAYFSSLKKTLIVKRTEEQRRAWAKEQCYIGLGVFLAACAHYRLDCCPMEGFQNHALDDLLDLPTMGLRSAVLVAAGKRSPDDLTANSKKVRVHSAQFLSSLT